MWEAIKNILVKKACFHEWKKESQFLKLKIFWKNFFTMPTFLKNFGAR